MLKICVVALAVFAALGAILTLGSTTGQGAAQATGTSGPIVIEFSTATIAAGDDSADSTEATNTPIVFEIATVDPTEAADAEATTAPTPATDDDEDDGNDDEAEVAASDWEGGFYQADPALQDYYGRPWVAVYGAQSDYPSASLVFTLDGSPEAPVTLTVLGLDDEIEGLNPLAIEVNGRRVYEGDDPFVNWNAVTGDPSVWSQVGFRMAPDLLEEGENTVTFINLSESDTFGGPPYFLLGDGRLSGEGVQITVGDDEQDDDLATSVPDDGNNGDPGNGGDNGNDDNNGNDDSPGNGNGNGNGNDDEDDEGDG